MSPLRNIISRAEPVFATGLPGAHRVIIFFIIQSFFSRETLGSVSSWLFIAQIAGFFTAIGWSSLILVRIPKSASSRVEAQETANLSWMSIISLAITVSIILFTGKILNAPLDAVYISLLLGGWTTYQTTRHYLIAKRKYKRIITLDLIIITSTAISLSITKNTFGIIFAISLPMFLAGIANTGIILYKERIRTITIKFEPKGIEFGFTNFLSGGIPLSIVPLALHFDDSKTAGAIAIFLSISAIAILIPRAISLHQISEISRSMATSGNIETLIPRMSRHILISNTLTTILNSLMAIYLITTNEEGLTYAQAVTLFILVIQNFISTQSLVDSNILMSAERSRFMLIMNLPLSTVFFSTAAILYIIKPQHSLIIICFTMLLLTITRSIATRAYARKELRNLTLLSHTKNYPCPVIKPPS
ncbi:hypothetical protein [Pseudomonas sp.]|uniref:hypothetical protein n=1 Tax=Pseudomonas sp. TaxID=306 RepID=UPI0025F525E6|nr:hypothetical protein [Pseudomonas sp.]